MPHATDRRDAPSDWVLRHLHLAPPDGPALDIACGGGRHVRALRAAGLRVVAVDRSLEGVKDLATDRGLELREQDLEGPDLNLERQHFGLVVVTNYLYRPHLPALAELLRPDGVLIYETFARGNERYGRPKNPDYLLEPGELRACFGSRLSIISYEEVDDGTAVRQRICAVGFAHPVVSSAARKVR